MPAIEPLHLGDRRRQPFEDRGNIETANVHTRQSLPRLGINRDGAEVVVPTVSAQVVDEDVSGDEQALGIRVCETLSLKVRQAAQLHEGINPYAIERGEVQRQAMNEPGRLPQFNLPAQL
jgi:hypothetical protein